MNKVKSTWLEKMNDEYTDYIAVTYLTVGQSNEL